MNDDLGQSPAGLLESLRRLTALEHLPRTGWCQRSVPSPESIADHVLGTAFLALGLAPKVEPALDVDRTVALALIHDAPEALVGDLPLSGSKHFPAGAKRAAEEGAAKELLPSLSGEAYARWTEYQAQETKEARLAKLCDKLHLGARLVEVQERAPAAVPEFMRGLRTLDCSEFLPALEFQRVLLDRLESRGATSRAAAPDEGE